MTPPLAPTAALVLPSLAGEDRGSWDVWEDTAADGVRGDAALAETELLIDRLAPALAHADLYQDATGGGLRRHLDQLRRLSGVTTAAIARASAAYDRSGALREDGHTSLNGHFRDQGHTDHDAATLTRLANGLDDVPETADALANGEISAATADTIIGAVKAGRLGDDPGAVERELLERGRTSGVKDLRGHIRREEQRRDGSRLLKDSKRQHALRSMTLHEQDDGMWRIFGVLPGELGEMTKVLFSALETRDPADTPDHQRRGSVQRTADAFADIIAWQLDHRGLPTDRGQTRPHVIVTVDADTVVTDITDSTTGQAKPPTHPVWADLPPGQFQWSVRPVPPQTVRRICCDANMTRLLTNSLSQVLDIGKETATWSGPLRKAITFRDGHCRGPRCDRPIGWTEIHHIQWHRHDGPTKLDNGISLCRRCHDLVHHDRWQIQLDPLTAEAIWTSPSGEVVRTHASPPGQDHRRRTA